MNILRAEQPDPSLTRYLAADAEAVNHRGPLPNLTRSSFTTPDGRVSALNWSDFAGADPLPPITVLHGMGLNAHSFDRFVLALKHPATVFDLPGHGESDWRDDADYSPRQLATTITPLIAAEKQVLIGHSLGGLAANLVAQRVPEKIKQLILIDITPAVRNGKASSTVMEFITGQRVFESREQMVDRAIDFGIGSDREALSRGVFFNSRQRPDDGFEWIHHFAHLPGLGLNSDSPELTESIADGWQALTEHRMPVHLIAASSGMVDAEMIDEFRERVPGASVHRIAGTHNLQESNPLELARVIAEIVSGS